MTLEFIDSFDHYASADITDKWTALIGNPEIGAFGRNGTDGCRIDSGDVIQKSFPALQTYKFGVACKQTIAVGADKILCYFLENAIVHCTLYVTAAQALQFRRSTTIVLDTSAGGVVPVDSWFYLEVSLTVDNVVGAFEVKIDGVTVCSGNNVDTQTGGTATWNGLQLMGGINYTQLDDFYLLNTAGGAPQNDFLGDIRIEALFPDGAGANTDWTPSAGANWQCVDENPPNDDVDYNATAVVTDVDTFTMDNIGIAGGTIFGIQTVNYARKDDAGAVTLDAIVRSGGIDYTGASKALGDTYDFKLGIMENDPDTAVAWLIADINAMQFGYERSV